MLMLDGIGSATQQRIAALGRPEHSHQTASGCVAPIYSGDTESQSEW